jgi:hypothetical protein
MRSEQRLGPTAEKDGAFLPFAAHSYGSATEIDVLDTNPDQFSDAAARRVEHFDHGFVSDAARRFDESSDIRCRNHARKNPSHPAPATDESWGDAIDDPSHVKEIEESPQRVKMPIIAVYRKITVHCLDKEVAHLHMSDRLDGPRSEKMAKRESHFRVRLMRASRKTLRYEPLAEFPSQFGIGPVDDRKQRSQQRSRRRIPIVFRRLVHGEGSFRPKEFRAANPRRSMSHVAQKSNEFALYRRTCASATCQGPFSPNVHGHLAISQAKFLFLHLSFPSKRFVS